MSFAGLLAGRGVVVVDHGDTRTTYEPVERHRRRSAHAVAAGDRDRPPASSPARTASRGPACTGAGCAGETYLDPLGLVGAGPVRLLPLWRDVPVPVTGPLVTVPWSTAYAAVLRRIETLVARSPPAVYARGCACW